MSKLFLFVSATFVLIFAGHAFASPQNEVPETRETEPAPTPTPFDDNLSLSKPPKLPGKLPPPEPRYYTARQALTFRTGVVSDPDTHNLTSPLVGFQYIFPKFISPKLEGGADVHENGRGHIHAGIRWYWWERNYFRPSVKFAFDHLLVGSESLGTITKFENNYLRGSAALEYTFYNPYSLRLEGELLLGPKEFAQELTLGVSCGW